MILSIAIYHGLSSHYNIYDYIIHWCQRNNFDCTIYTNDHPNDHPNDYIKKFPALIHNSCSNFINNAHLYHIVFLNTSHDHTFDKSWFDLYGLRYKIIDTNIHIDNLDEYVKDNHPKLFTQLTYDIIIPKNIFFMWLAKPDTNDNVPTKYKKNIRTFRKHNPGYTIKIWNLKNTSEIIARYLPEFYQAFLTMTPWICKCDFARFCLIYIFGGIYADLDFYCNKCLDGLLEDKESVFTFEPKEHAENFMSILYGENYLYNGFFASISKTLFIYGWLETMASNVLISDVLLKTGPVGFGLYYEKISDKPEIIDTHKIIPYNINHQISFNVINIDDNYVYTLWNEGTYWYNYLIIQNAYVLIIIIIMILLFILYLVTK